MNDALLYFLKVNIAIAIFYIFYRLVFYNDTLWIARRLYLALAVMVAVVYPLISLTDWLEQQQAMQEILTGYVALPELIVRPNTPSPLNYETTALGLYGLVALVLSIRMMVQLASIFRWKIRSKRANLQEVDILSVDKNIAPFSFFNLIFINPALHTEQETKQILAHERTHARQWHSMDVLLSELLTITCWINPAAWLMKREIRQNLEFLADNSVLQSGFDSKNYQYHLLQLSYQIPDVNLANKFNVLPLKKRIMKMNQQKTAKAGILKYSLIVPLALALVLSSNAQTLVKKAKEALTSDNKKVATEQKAPVVKKKSTTKTTVKFTAPVIKKDEVASPTKPTNKNKVFDTVEKMPQYLGGDKELMGYLAKNIKYPVKAQENGVQGKVILRFVVDAQGKVNDVSVVKSKFTKAGKSLQELVVVGYGKDPKTAETSNKVTEETKLLEQEAVRVVNGMGNWTPGEQSGEKVAVYYTLPITFKLE